MSFKDYKEDYTQWSSKYKGVMYNYAKDKWIALIKPYKTWEFIGYYDTAKDAAIAYDKVAQCYDMTTNILSNKDLTTK